MYIINEMKSFNTYIILFVLLIGFSFSKSLGQKTFLDVKKIVIIDEVEISDDNDYKRKRAHKRKRKIRPRRNGF